ncbi:RTA1 like protein [Aspergillus eucalypticola CBS 122712]|uniref:RTA1 like protein n=1 Tax=Aspergillus eucalypticola (strain CBS 122712 / IBT 29274) TaxID=1448314 RepID=A0A317UQY0_ASPEC|nr:RTA1 like protein [Aspergillus eucalypticola CBS 122712]PWY64433.1 RTA1 like protein [Aspergillus eucalypticola CBS 122712]
MSITCTHVTPECPVTATTYGYYPNLGGNIFFAVYFGLLGTLQLGLGVYYRSWTMMIAMVIGGYMELAGYIGRILMNHNPWDQGAFKLQIVCLVLAPTFIAAGIYLTLKHLFTWIFISCDVGSLILQAAGGGVAAAAGSENQSLLKVGDDIMVAGIAFQVGTMSVCGLLALDFFIRVVRKGPGLGGEKFIDENGNLTGPKNLRLVIWAGIVAYFATLIRCIYRIPEMAGGWGNPLMQREDEFLVLDGMMMAIAVSCLTYFYPGFFLESIRKGMKKTPKA